MELLVRKMREEDLLLVEEIEHEAFGAHLRSTAMDVNALRDELVRPWAFTLVAEEPERAQPIVGFLLAWLVVDEIHVLNVAVTKRERRKGIARKLLAELFSFAREKSVVCMYLEVRLGNVAAIELYRVHGFYATNLRRSYYADGEDALEMRLDFDASGGIIFRADQIVPPIAPPIAQDPKS